MYEKLPFIFNSINSHNKLANLTAQDLLVASNLKAT